MSVVYASFLLIGEHLVRLRDFDEAIRGDFVPRIFVAALALSLAYQLYQSVRTDDISC